MINYALKNSWSRFGAEKKEYAEKYGTQRMDILRAIDNGVRNKLELGALLIKLWDSGDYSYGFLTKGMFNIYIGTSANKNLSPKAFFAVCEYEFGLDKATVSRLMNVVSEFGDEAGRLKEKYKKYKYSVLCEMLPLKQEQREKITPEMTVSQVREYKKSLVATSQQEKSDMCMPEKPPDEYEQFKDWKRIDFCKRIVSLEEENQALKNEIEKLKKAKKTTTKGTKTK